MCLTIIELLFLVAGLWLVILGKVPSGLFRVLFGKGQYVLSPTRARLFGLLLTTPFLASFLIMPFLLAALLGPDGIGYGISFEVIYTSVIAIVSVVIARKIRVPEIQEPDISTPEISPEHQTKTSYYLRLLIILGLILLVFITFVSSFALIATLVSTAVYGTRWTGDFWSDIFPFILMITIIGTGLFGIFKLSKLLRK